LTVLKIDSNLDIESVKNSLARSFNKDIGYKNYTLEVSLIYKIIHEHSNYEDYQWELYGYEKSFVEAELKSLLFKISELDKTLTWDCLTILRRYMNLYKTRNQINKKYIRSYI